MKEQAINRIWDNGADIGDVKAMGGVFGAERITMADRALFGMVTFLAGGDDCRNGYKWERDGETDYRERYALVHTATGCRLGIADRSDKGDAFVFQFGHSGMSIRVSWDPEAGYSYEAWTGFFRKADDGKIKRGLRRANCYADGLEIAFDAMNGAF